MFIGNRFKKSICLFLNPIVELLLFCLYMSVIPIKYVYTKGKMCELLIIWFINWYSIYVHDRGKIIANLLKISKFLGGGFMVFDATSNNISVISWWSILLMEIGGNRSTEITTDLLQVTDKLYHIMLYEYKPTWERFELTILVVICTDCLCSCKSNYHTIITTTSPLIYKNIGIYNTYR